MTGRIRIGDRSYEVSVERLTEGCRVVVDGEEFHVQATKVDPAQRTALMGDDWVPVRVEEWRRGASVASAAGGRTRVRSPMAGKLVELRAAAGAKVARGDVLFILEAMKMQNEVKSPADGVIATVNAQAGETLDTERVVVEIAS